MTFSDIVDEFECNGRLTRRSIESLRAQLLGNDPFEAITVATDCACFELIPEIVKGLDSRDPMVRWNAIGSLHTRFRVVDCIEKTLQMARSEDDTMVRAIALNGVGEVLPKVKDKGLQCQMASVLISTSEDINLFNELRAAAYEGILAAMDVLPLDRPPANAPMNSSTDLDSKMMHDFRQKYLRNCH